MSLMARFVPGELHQLFAVERGTLPRGPARAKLFLDNMMLLGEGMYACGNGRLAGIMQPPPGDPRRVAYCFLRGDMPLCPPAGTSGQLPS